jgi:hypothetical protein
MILTLTEYPNLQASIHLFWLLNNHFIGETVERHDMAVDLRPGP